MAELEIPQILQMPDKLLTIIQLINKYRYFMAEGGRGGGKSQSMGRILLYLGERKQFRIVCGRETQNSITESVYSLLIDLINTYNLNYEVQASKLIHRITGTTINFRGFREQGRFNIQGMEGVDILHIDEAQAITKQTLDVLIPTIRKENAKVFFSMNRHVEKDPVFDKFVNRDDCLHIHINYNENKFCTEALKHEAEECKKLSESDYNHIWLGEPLTKTEDALFSYQELIATRLNKHVLSPGYGIRLMGFDVARFGDDKCGAVAVQQMGALHWEEVYTDMWEKRDLNYTTGRILMTHMEQGATKSKIDEDGIGAGPLDTLVHGRGEDSFEGFRNPPLSYKDDKYYANVRTKNAYKVKDMVRRGHIAINSEELIKELCTLKFTFDHMQRRILISKEIMKNKFHIPSPNLADSFIMAVSLIGEVKEKQDTQYEHQETSYKETDILSDAGIM